MSAYVDHTLKFTYEDLKQIPEDDPLRHEIYDGVHVASPSPATRHQRVSKRMQHQLYTQIELTGRGEIFYSPMDVELGRYDVVEPDLFVVLRASHRIIEESHIRGVPDLVVEILSPSTTKRDRGIKRERYEAAKVPEYWIVDPDERCVEVYRYDHSVGAFGRPELFAETLTYRAGDQDVAVDLTRLW